MPPAPRTTRRLLPPLLSIGVPIVSLTLLFLAGPDAPTPFPEFGTLWFGATVMLGAVGIVLLPMRWWAKLIAVAAYIACASFLILMIGLSLACYLYRECL